MFEQAYDIGAGSGHKGSHPHRPPGLFLIKEGGDGHGLHDPLSNGSKLYLNVPPKSIGNDGRPHHSFQVSLFLKNWFFLDK